MVEAAWGFCDTGCSGFCWWCHVKWLFCQHGLARPRFADGEDGVQIWIATANMFNDKEWLLVLGILVLSNNQLLSKNQHSVKCPCQQWLFVVLIFFLLPVERLSFWRKFVFQTFCVAEGGFADGASAEWIVKRQLKSVSVCETCTVSVRADSKISCEISGGLKTKWANFEPPVSALGYPFE